MTNVLDLIGGATARPNAYGLRAKLVRPGQPARRGFARMAFVAIPHAPTRAERATFRAARGYALPCRPIKAIHQRQRRVMVRIPRAMVPASANTPSMLLAT